MEITKEEIDKAFEKYLNPKPPSPKEEQKKNAEAVKIDSEVVSREYKEFKKEAMPKPLGLYETIVKTTGSIISISPSPRKREELQDSCRISFIDARPEQIMGAAVIISLFIGALGVFLSIVMFGSLFFTFFFVILAFILYFMILNVPKYSANIWRMKASNQMVLCIFYVVTYMRHTSNLEGAINFAATHLAPPLSLDMKKVLWDVETETYPSAKDSLTAYLDTWKKYNLEFVEAFNLVLSSLYEPSEERRIALLEKSLQVILDETFEKMMHYAYNLKSPITMLHMLGIVLPVLGLIILPLAINFLRSVKWYYLFILYDIFLPIIVYYFGRSMLSSRPTGYGDTDISAENPSLKVYRNPVIRFGNKVVPVPAVFVAFFVGIIIMVIGFSPLIIHYLDPNFDFSFIGTIECKPNQGGDCFIGYRLSKYSTADNPVIIGPYGTGASLLSVFVILGLGMGIGLYYRMKSKNIIKIREKTKKLEKEFATALFQLGSRLGDELPPEIAFQKASETMAGTLSGQFFDIITQNIKRLGMNVEQAIFDKDKGAIKVFPGKVIESSMKVLIESSKKGPLTAANAVMSVSEYINQMHKVNERLRDLLAEIISSMKTQINFMVPVISGIVVGITSMITTIMGKLSLLLKESQSIEGVSQTQGILEMFGDGMPTFYFQIIVGIYVVEIIYILTVLATGVENGSDKVGERYYLGKNLMRSTAVYCAIAFLVMLLFNMVAGQILSSLATQNKLNTTNKQCNK